MAWLKCGACAAFVVGAALFCVGPVDAVVQAEPATQRCLLAFNLARTAKLNTRLGLLARHEASEAAAAGAVPALVGDDENDCQVPRNLLPVNANIQGYVHPFPFNAPANCADFVQAALEAAANGLGNYEGQNWDNGVAAPFNHPAVQNIAYILFATSTGVGCGVTSNCRAGHNLLLCRFNPSLSDRFNEPPFAEAFFKALRERAVKGIDVSTLTEADLNTGADKPGEGPGGGASSGSFGVSPGVIPAAALTIASLLGLVSTR